MVMLLRKDTNLDKWVQDEKEDIKLALDVLSWMCIFNKNEVSMRLEINLDLEKAHVFP